MKNVPSNKNRCVEDQPIEHETRHAPAGRKPFEVPQLRWEERLTTMTADQTFFGAES